MEAEYGIWYINFNISSHDDRDTPIENHEFTCYWPEYITKAEATKRAEERIGKTITSSGKNYILHSIREMKNKG